MFSFAGVLAIFQALGMLFLPQSPRYLALKGNEQKVCRTCIDKYKKMSAN